MQTQSQSQPGDRQSLEDIGRRHGFTVEAAQAMADAVRRGNGTMAQFDHPEFSGSGQWMRSSVNDGVEHVRPQPQVARVGARRGRVGLAVEAACPVGARRRRRAGSRIPAVGPFRRLGQLVARRAVEPAPARARQNNQRYAYFPDQRRLVVDIGGEMSVYDTQDHRIGGVSQQQWAAAR